MKTYKITILITLDGVPDTYTSQWSGWDERTAISQAFLHYAQMGARELKVLDITEKN